MAAANSLILPVMTLFCTGLVESALSSASTAIEPPAVTAMSPDPTMLSPFIVLNEPFRSSRSR